MKHEEGARRWAPGVVAVAVLSYPCVNCALRDRVLGLAGMAAGERLAWVNANVRVISRVVVHPQFRALGLASRLVRVVCEESGVRWVEALAAMGRVHPFFARGGMREAGVGRRGVVYYVWEGRKGDRRQETGDRRQETVDRREARSRKPESRSQNPEV